MDSGLPHPRLPFSEARARRRPRRGLRALFERAHLRPRVLLRHALFRVQVSLVDCPRGDTLDATLRATSVNAQRNPARAAQRARRLKRRADDRGRELA